MDAALKLYQSTIVAASAIIIMNVIGSYVSAIGAGLACPDWPLCPFPESFPVLMEFLHRVWGLVVVATIAISVLRARGIGDVGGFRAAKLLVYTSLLIVLIQVALGAIVIFTTLRPEFVALHQLLAQVTLSLQVAAAGITWSTASRRIEAEKTSVKS
ncbi:MAG: COX15/CtaA family protein [Nitrososphaerota archaeon]